MRGIKILLKEVNVIVVECIWVCLIYIWKSKGESVNGWEYVGFFSKKKKNMISAPSKNSRLSSPLLHFFLLKSFEIHQSFKSPSRPTPKITSYTHIEAWFAFISHQELTFRIGAHWRLGFSFFSFKYKLKSWGRKTNSTPSSCIYVMYSIYLVFVVQIHLNYHLLSKWVCLSLIWWSTNWELIWCNWWLIYTPLMSIYCSTYQNLGLRSHNCVWVEIPHL